MVKNTNNKHEREEGSESGLDAKKAKGNNMFSTPQDWRDVEKNLDKLRLIVEKSPSDFIRCMIRVVNEHDENVIINTAQVVVRKATENFPGSRYQDNATISNTHTLLTHPGDDYPDIFLQNKTEKDRAECEKDKKEFFDFIEKFQRKVAVLMFENGQVGIELKFNFLTKSLKDYLKSQGLNVTKILDSYGAKKGSPPTAQKWAAFCIQLKEEYPEQYSYILDRFQEEVSPSWNTSTNTDKEDDQYPETFRRLKIQRKAFRQMKKEKNGTIPGVNMAQHQAYKGSEFDKMSFADAEKELAYYGYEYHGINIQRPGKAGGLFNNPQKPEKKLLRSQSVVVATMMPLAKVMIKPEMSSFRIGFSFFGKTPLKIYAIGPKIAVLDAPKNKYDQDDDKLAGEDDDNDDEQEQEQEQEQKQYNTHVYQPMINGSFGYGPSDDFIQQTPNDQDSFLPGDDDAAADDGESTVYKAQPPLPTS